MQAQCKSSVAAPQTIEIGAEQSLSTAAGGVSKNRACGIWLRAVFKIEFEIAWAPLTVAAAHRSPPAIC